MRKYTLKFTHTSSLLIVQIDLSANIDVSATKKRQSDKQSFTPPKVVVSQLIENAHLGSITALAFLDTPLIQYGLISVGEDGGIRVWDYLDGSKVCGFDTTKVRERS